MYDASFSSSSQAFVPDATSSLVPFKVLKDVPCNLFGLNCFTNTAGTFLVIDDNTVPASGATVAPKKVISLPANGTFMYDFGVPMRFTKGCIVLFSTNASPYTYTPSASAYVSGDTV